MTTHDKFPKSFHVLAALALTSIGHIPSALADNPPPCDPCRLDLPPAADPTHLKATVGAAKKAGLKGWAVPVTWNTIDVPHGAYTPECANVNHQGLQAFDGWYVPTTMTKTFYMNSGTTRFAMSDNFYARYFDPCKGGPYKSGGSTYDLVKVKAPTPPPVGPPPIGGGGDGDGGGGNGDGDGDPPIEPPAVDPYEGGEESHDPCPQGPFVPQQCTPFQHPDTRVAVDLPAATQVEIVSEDIGFQHGKRGFVQYDYLTSNTLTPKYFLQEDAQTTLSGGNPESPVGGSITQRVCPMTNELIVTAKSGNPSWYGVRDLATVNLSETTASGTIDVTSYDDCPNLLNDEPATMLFASSLSDEYTKERMRNDAFQNAWQFKGDGYYLPSSGTAGLWITNSEESVYYYKTRYKIRIPSNVQKPYKALWVQEFTPEDDNLYDSEVPDKQYIFKHEYIQGNESSTYEIDPQSDPEKEGTWETKLVPYSIKVDQDKADPNGVPPKYSNAPKNYIASNLFVVWPNHEVTIKVVLPAPFDQGDHLPPGFIKWEIPNYSIPDNTLEAVDLKWDGQLSDNTKVINVTVGGLLNTIHIKVQNVGFFTQLEASALVPNAAAALYSYREEAIGYGSSHPVRGQKDAMRHSYWCALAVSTLGVSAGDVYFVATAHEYDNRFDGKQPAFCSTMDLKNNDIGMATNHQVNGLPDKDAIKQDLTQKYVNGEMYIWEIPGSSDVGQEQSEGILIKSNSTRIH